jgi:hypothetical protein
MRLNGGYTIQWMCIELTLFRARDWKKSKSVEREAERHRAESSKIHILRNYSQKTL